MNRLQEIICKNCQDSIKSMCILKSGSGCETVKELSAAILAEYVPRDEVDKIIDKHSWSNDGYQTVNISMDADKLKAELSALSKGEEVKG